jgi:hypothetical protein
MRMILVGILLLPVITMSGPPGAEAQAPTPTYAAAPHCEDEPRGSICVTVISEYVPFPDLGDKPIAHAWPELAVPLGILSTIVGIIGVISSRRFR